MNISKDGAQQNLFLQINGREIILKTHNEKITDNASLVEIFNSHYTYIVERHLEKTKSFF